MRWIFYIYLIENYEDCVNNGRMTQGEYSSKSNCLIEEKNESFFFFLSSNDAFCILLSNYI